MPLRFLTKTTLALFTCFIFTGAIPLPDGERSSEAAPMLQMERVVARQLFVISISSPDIHRRWVSPFGSAWIGDGVCWGRMTYDNLKGMGYSNEVASWVGGEAMRNYPGLDPTVEVAMQLGVSFEDICKVLANCMVYCGWE